MPGEVVTAPATLSHGHFVNLFTKWPTLQPATPSTRGTRRALLHAAHGWRYLRAKERRRRAGGGRCGGGCGRWRRSLWRRSLRADFCPREGRLVARDRDTGLVHPTPERVPSDRGTSSKRDGDARCARVAAGQYGLITLEQAAAAGLSRSQVARRVIGGTWIRISPGLFRMTSVPRSWEQSLLAACLTGRRLTAASHRSAARLHRLDGFESSIVEITGSRPRSLRVHSHLSELSPREVTRRRNIPTTKLERTLRDLGAVVSPGRVEEAVDCALRKEATTVPRLFASLVSNRNGHRGAAVLRQILAERDPDGAVSESRFETRLGALLRRGRLPIPIRQHEVSHRGRTVARCDLAYPEHRLAIEAMSVRWHFGRAALERDAQRRNALTRAGWRFIEITWGQMTNRPNDVIGLVAETLGYDRLL